MKIDQWQEEYDPPKPWTYHLEDLRGTLTRSIFIILVCWCGTWFLQPYFYTFLTQSFHIFIPKNIDYKETFRSITDPFMLKIKFSFLMSVILCAPYLFFEIIKFASPGLKKKERRLLYAFLPLSMILFGWGIFTCWLILPNAVGWLTQYVSEFPNTSLYQEPGTLIFFILKMGFSFGIGFQLPLVIYFLSKIGILTPDGLLASWRYVILGIFILSMIFVPSADPLSLFMLALPLCILFFITVAILKLSLRRQRSI